MDANDDFRKLHETPQALHVGILKKYQKGIKNGISHIPDM